MKMLISMIINKYKLPEKKYPNYQKKKDSNIAMNNYYIKKARCGWFRYNYQIEEMF